MLVLNKLQHPNMVRLLGYCSQKGEILLVSELWNHGSLEDVSSVTTSFLDASGPGLKDFPKSDSQHCKRHCQIRYRTKVRHPLPRQAIIQTRGSGAAASLTWEVRVNIACRIAEVLDFLHKKNVIHRYCKSAKALLGEVGPIIRKPSETAEGPPHIHPTPFSSALCRTSHCFQVGVSWFRW